VARNRQRAKQRQRRRHQSPRPAPGTGGIVPSPPEVVGPEPAAPDPLEDASGDAEIAELAEAGARPVPDLDLDEGVGAELDPDEYPQPDETEGIAGADDALDDSDAFGNPLPAAAAKTPRRSRETAGGELPKEGNRVVNFIRACIAELRRVQWPNRQQVGQATGVVVGFVIIAGAYLGLLDAAFSRLVSAIL
jgi:preprotein translocase SecE subunit